MATSRRRVKVAVSATPRRIDLLRRFPADRAANATVRNLLHRFYQYRGRYTLSGQEQGDNGENMDDLLVAHNGGIRPAIRGYDRYVGGLTAGNATTFLSWMVDDWTTARVIPTISNHWTPAVSTEVPPGDASLDDPVVIDDLFTSGTTVYTRYNTWKQNIGDDLTTLQTAGVPVLFRPFHEAAGTWFWWSQSTGANYVRLWRDIFNYLTVTRSVHNLIWVWNCGIAGTGPQWYPGPDYCDIVSNDSYTLTDGDYSSRSTLLATFDSPKKLRAMAEIGYVPLNNQAFTELPMSYSMTWTGSFLTANSDANLTAYYASPYTVTRNNVRQFVEGTLA